MKYVLDAGPMIVFLDDDRGAEVIERVLTEPGGTCYAHIFNLTEVYYIYFRPGSSLACPPLPPCALSEALTE